MNNGNNYKKVSDLPLVLSVHDLARVLGLEKTRPMILCGQAV